ncbi:sulfur carrier protein adenylyltransferase [Chrysoperla carnea]|uniref:sulfur carrier protein adenylyltransferase n=1 Tax=Chrysoperla carnea TaxID=189513 RepID=UPI001D094CD7|nr:sulfur carrier protein adenylyltransferase [Chrysoperla carnea]
MSIEELEKEIQELKQKLQIKENELRILKSNDENNKLRTSYSDNFEKHEIEKYCRQIILPEIGIEGQKRITSAKVLVVGAGGLGCPAAQYLVAAGIGTLGLVDSDVVSISNLHRQILYNEVDLHLPKVDVAFKKLLSMNKNLNCVRIQEKLTRMNCAEIFHNFDVILDCTDNVPTRYLVNDVCVLLNKPLVAGNAIKFEGQLLVCIPGKTSCYRCLFPSPPSRECVGSCNEDGVLGSIPGIIGVLQSLEALKIIIGKTLETDFQKLTIFDGSNCRFRHLNLRTPKPDCSVCSSKSIIKLSSLPEYEEWCGLDSQETIANYPPIVILPSDQRVTVQELVEWNKINKKYLILDVRPKVEFEMCHLPNSINITLKELCSKANRDKCFKDLEDRFKKEINSVSILVLCRCGNDSQKAVQILNENNSNKNLSFFDIAGGLYAWNEYIDNSFPLY